MKKSLIALAALATVGAAQAQSSSVTLYGIVDAGYKSTDLKAKVGADEVSLDSRGATNSMLQTSRWGIRGTEDLGGGLRAGFQLEANLVTDNANAIANTASTSTMLGTRPSFLSLSSANAGELRIGRQDTPLHVAFGRFNTGGLNNMPGSIYSVFATGALVDNAGSLSNADLAFSTADAAGLGRYATTIDKAVTYTTPVMNGFQAQVLVSDASDKVAASDGSTSANASLKAKQQGLSLTYKVGKLDVGYALHKSKTEGGLTVSTLAVAASATAESTQQQFGASYDFGSFQGFAQHFKMKNETATATVFDNKASEVGVRIPVGKTLVFASYVDGENNWGTSTNYDRKGYQAGAIYSLSKRTNLYAIYGDQELKGTGSVSGNKIEEKALGAGIRHTF